MPKKKKQNGEKISLSEAKKKLEEVNRWYEAQLVLFRVLDLLDELPVPLELLYHDPSDYRRAVREMFGIEPPHRPKIIEEEEETTGEAGVGGEVPEVTKEMVKKIEKTLGSPCGGAEPC